MCNLCTPRPIFRPTYWPTLDWSISRYISWHLTDLSVDISTDTRPTYRPRYVGQHLARVSSVRRYVHREWRLSSCRLTCQSSHKLYKIMRYSQRKATKPIPREKWGIRSGQPSKWSKFHYPRNQFWTSRPHFLSLLIGQNNIKCTICLDQN